MSDQHVTTVWLNIRALESALSTQSKQCAFSNHLVQHWILYGSGALVNRDNTQHTLYNRENRKEAWSWTQGTSNRQKHELTSSCSNDNNRPRWRSSITTQAQTEAHHHAMETTQHLKIGTTNSKHTWECNTTFTHCSYREQHNQQQG